MSERLESSSCDTFPDGSQSHTPCRTSPGDPAVAHAVQNDLKELCSRTRHAERAQGALQSHTPCRKTSKSLAVTHAMQKTFREPCSRIHHSERPQRALQSHTPCRKISKSLAVTHAMQNELRTPLWAFYAIKPLQSHTPCRTSLNPLCGHSTRQSLCRQVVVCICHSERVHAKVVTVAC